MDSTDSPDTEKKRSPRRTPPPAEQATPEPEPEDTAAVGEKPAAPDPAPEWLRFTGQTPTVFPDLGGEVEPGQVVRPRDAALAEVLLKRADFQPAEAPAPDAEPGTAN